MLLVGAPNISRVTIICDLSQEVLYVKDKPLGSQLNVSEALTEGVMEDHSTHVGRCFCGSVELRVTGKPEVMGFCHCSSCREWGAAPINAFTLWRPDKVKVTK